MTALGRGDLVHRRPPTRTPTHPHPKSGKKNSPKRGQVHGKAGENKNRNNAAYARHAAPGEQEGGERDAHGSGMHMKPDAVEAP